MPAHSNRTRNDLEALFEPIMIGSKEIKNRIIMPAMGTLYATWDGRVTTRMIDHYRVRARGGVGLVVVEYAYVHHTGQVYNGQLAVDRDQTIAGLEKLSAAIKDEGAAAALQVVHGGRICFPEVTGAMPLAPSPVATVGGAMPRAVTLEEIEELGQAFADAAVRAREAGFDIVELHMTHGYLIHSFLTPIANQRDDTYGGSLSNRARFAIEILKKVRCAAGSGIEITCKIPGSDYLKGGLGIESIQRFSNWLQVAGAAALTVSGGLKNETDQMVTPPMSVPRGFRVELANAVKQKVSIPVATVGRVNDPFLAAAIIGERNVDMVATGRALLADPEWPNKATDGRTDEICPCIACNQGCIGRIMKGLPITCLGNPALGRERLFRLKVTSSKKIVAIVGGGPGGMTAARILTLRGHRVVLVEKTGSLGGRFAIAAVPPFKQEIAFLVNYMYSEIERLGIEIRLNTPLTRPLLEEIKPDFVLLASGAENIPLESLDGSKDSCFFPEDVILDPSLVGSHVVIVGGGLVGLETAEVLLEENKSVSVLEVTSQLALDLNERERKQIIERLWSRDIDVFLRARFVGHRPSERLVTLEREGVCEHLYDVDSVISAVGYQSTSNQWTDLTERLGIPTKVIGDALQPRSALEAIREGFEFGFSF